ncbi:phosphotransferase family protein [Marinomonas sp. IMCC 4694]|uniref:phosphotransferase family protein n=1 Tax=Marinomonas sp. IMCC 4694 TaxID=2605432 RepID=UPI0011E61E15|nr:phosphotransferase [Marinomonas sp. IMCC 4694]
MIAKAHRLPKGQHSYCVFAIINHYLSEIGDLVAEQNILVCEYAYLQRLYKTLTPPPLLLPLVLCHNDINPMNTLMNHHGLWFIDWEYSGVGDPLFDLAVVAKSHNLTTAQTALLVNAYCPSLPDDESFQVIEVYKKAYGLREMVWLLLKHLMTPSDTESLQGYFQFKETPSLNPFYS